MSDTLQEGEDQMSTERIDQIESKNADWCDDCHGYTHMPWCSEYKEPQLTELQKSVMDHDDDCARLDRNTLTTTSKHQPAARGGGEEWRVVGIAEIVNEAGRTIAKGHGFNPELRRQHAQQIVTEHNQHQALVAERERLIVAAKAVVERLADLPRYLEKNGTDTLATMTAECLADLAIAIPAEQRSTSA